MTRIALQPTIRRSRLRLWAALGAVCWAVLFTVECGRFERHAAGGCVAAARLERAHDERVSRYDQIIDAYLDCYARAHDAEFLRRALGTADDALRRYPRSARMIWRKGWLYYLAGDRAKGDEFYAAALRVARENAVSDEIGSASDDDLFIIQTIESERGGVEESKPLRSGVEQ